MTTFVATAGPEFVAVTRYSRIPPRTTDWTLFFTVLEIVSVAFCVGSVSSVSCGDVHPGSAGWSILVSPSLSIPSEHCGSASGQVTVVVTVELVVWEPTATLSAEMVATFWMVVVEH